MIFCQEKKMSKKEAIKEVFRLNNLLDQVNIENDDLSKTIELKNNELEIKNNELEIKNNEFDELFLTNKNLELEISKLLNNLQIEKDLAKKIKKN